MTTAASPSNNCVTPTRLAEFQTLQKELRASMSGVRVPCSQLGLDLANQAVSAMSALSQDLRSAEARRLYGYTSTVATLEAVSDAACHAVNEMVNAASLMGADW